MYERYNDVSLNKIRGDYVLDCAPSPVEVGGMVRLNPFRHVTKPFTQSPPIIMDPTLNLRPSTASWTCWDPPIAMEQVVWAWWQASLACGFQHHNKIIIYMWVILCVSWHDCSCSLFNKVFIILDLPVQSWGCWLLLYIKIMLKYGICKNIMSRVEIVLGRSISIIYNIHVLIRISTR